MFFFRFPRKISTIHSDKVCGTDFAWKNMNTTEYKAPPHFQWSEQKKLAFDISLYKSLRDFNPSDISDQSSFSHDLKKKFLVPGKTSLKNTSSLSYA